MAQNLKNAQSSALWEVLHATLSPVQSPFTLLVISTASVLLDSLSGFESAFLNAQDKELHIFTSSSVCLFGAEIESHLRLAHILAFSDSTSSCPFLLVPIYCDNK